MSVSTAPVRLPVRRFGETARHDAWWIQPLVVFLGLSTFLVYSTWAAFQGDHYTYGPYLSPFYSPEIFGNSPHSWFGPPPGSVARVAAVLAGAADSADSRLFRLTCYYYRGAYYKAFWADPPSCTVGEPRSTYRGEHSFPLILQNIHRYMLFLSLARLVPPVHGCVEGAVVHRSGDRHGVVRHRRRHARSGHQCVALERVSVRLSFAASSRGRLRRRVVAFDRMGARAYSCVSCLNRRHMLWAWCSLFSVGFADLYVRLCSMGVWSDFRIW